MIHFFKKESLMENNSLRKSPVGNFEYTKSLKKNNPGYIFNFINVEKYLNRPLASLLVKAVFKTKVTPNQLTFLSFFVGLLAVYLISLGTYTKGIIGGILIYLSFVIDGADGMLARSRNSGTPFGKYLDLFLDRILDFFILLGVTAGIFRQSGNMKILLLGIFSLALYMLQVNLFYISNLYKKKDTGESGEARALIGFLIMIAAFTDKLIYVLYFAAIEVALNLIYRIINFLSSEKKQSL